MHLRNILFDGCFRLILHGFFQTIYLSPKI